MDIEHHRILMQVLCATEVVFTPFRWNLDNGPAATAVFEKLIGFSTTGVGLSLGTQAREQKQFQKLVAELESARLLEVFRGKARRIGSRLTARGDAFARVIAPTQTIRESWPTFRAIAKVVREFTQGFVCEDDILGIPYEKMDDDKLVIGLEDDCLPLLCNGLVESYGDLCGRIGYRVTAAGHQALAKGKPRAPRIEPRCDQKLSEEFVDLYLDGLKTRETWKPSRPNHVAIPLSAGLWPERRSKAKRA